MGEVRVPKAAKWQAQTQRAVENFPISGTTVERSLISALAAIKGAAALENARLKMVDKKVAARHPPGGRRGGRRPVGPGISRRRLPDRVRHLHQHEHERGPGHPRHRAPRQPGCTPTTTSTPRSRPTTCSRRPSTWPPPPRSSERAHPRPRAPGAGPCGRRAGSSRTWSSPGRTHLMDATPVTLGQEFGGYATAVELGHRAAAGVLCPGSASCRSAGPRSGPGINAPRGFARGVIRRLAEERSLPLARGPGSLRGPGRSRRPGGGVGRAAHHRRVAVQVRHRPALDGQRPPDRSGRDPHTGPAARLVDHARARSTRSCPRRSRRSWPRSSATTPPSPSVVRPATSSSTSCFR